MTVDGRPATGAPGLIGRCLGAPSLLLGAHDHAEMRKKEAVVISFGLNEAVELMRGRKDARTKAFVVINDDSLFLVAIAGLREGYLGTFGWPCF